MYRQINVNKFEPLWLITTPALLHCTSVDVVKGTLCLHHALSKLGSSQCCLVPLADVAQWRFTLQGRPPVSRIRTTCTMKKTFIYFIIISNRNFNFFQTKIIYPCCIVHICNQDLSIYTPMPCIPVPLCCYMQKSSININYNNVMFAIVMHNNTLHNLKLYRS